MKQDLYRGCLPTLIIGVLMTLLLIALSTWVYNLFILKVLMV